MPGLSPASASLPLLDKLPVALHLTASSEGAPMTFSTRQQHHKRWSNCWSGVRWLGDVTALGELTVKNPCSLGQVAVVIVTFSPHILVLVFGSTTQKDPSLASQLPSQIAHQSTQVIEKTQAKLPIPLLCAGMQNAAITDDIRLEMLHRHPALRKSQAKKKGTHLCPRDYVMNEKNLPYFDHWSSRNCKRFESHQTGLQASQN